MARKKKTSTTATADVATLKEVIATAGDEVNPLAAEEYKCLGEEGTRELIKLCKDNFLQDVTAQGDGKVLTLSASPTADGKGVSITGEADTYTKQEITSMISTSQEGGITGATTDATPPLSLDAEVSDGLLTIRGGVDVSDKQDKLNYYIEQGSGATQCADIIVQNGSDYGAFEVGTSSLTMRARTIDIATGNQDNSAIVIEGGSGDIYLSGNKALYNNKEIATVDDVDTAKSAVEAEIPTKVSALNNDAGYITESAVEDKQDKLQYYEEYSTSGDYGARIEAGDGVFFVQNASTAEGNYTGHAFIGQGDGVGVEIQNHVIYIGGETVSIDSAPNPATYNGKEIATVDDIPVVSVGERNLLTNSQFDGLDGWSYNSAYATLSDEKFNGWNVVAIHFSNASNSRIVQDIDIEEGKYYKFSCWAKSDGVGRTVIDGSSLQTVYSENYDYTGEDWRLITMILKATSTTSSSVSIQNYPHSSSVTCDVYISMPTFEEISEMAAVEDKFADVITLDSLRQKYPSETLVSMLGYWFASGESGNITAAQIMDYDKELQTARIRFKHSTGSTSPYYLQVLCSTSTTETYIPIFNASPQTVEGTNMITYFDLIVPCDSGSLKSIDGYQYRLNLTSL